MRVVIQRVLESFVTVDGACIGAIGPGMMVLCGFEPDDTEDDLAWTARKIAGLRIFDDAEGVMNLPVTEVGGGILVVSQFTLMASTKKGNRPSYVKAAGPDIAIPLYERFKELLKERLASNDCSLIIARRSCIIALAKSKQYAAKGE